MYTVTIPVMIRDGFDREATLREVKRARAERIMLAVPREFTDTADGLRIKTNGYIELLCELVPYYRENGLDVGIWIGQTMGHGGGSFGATAYQDFVSITGTDCPGSYCAADPKFREDVSTWAANLAKTGTGLIILDDDWRMSAHGDNLYAGCMCKEHIHRYNEMCGEELSREEIVKRTFTGEPSEYRRIWRELMGGDMLRLAHEIRAAVDLVNPECRIGICTAPTVIDLDGADFMEIADVLAGDTRPYARLIGAPYWAKTGAALNSVIMSERLYAHFAEEWQRKTNAEILGEGDAYPRPRFACPSAYLEIFDTALRADGHFTGSMKYMMDYFSTPDYEKGYIDKAERNYTLARKIEEFFAGKRQTGFKAVEYQHLFAGMELPSDPCAGNLTAYKHFYGTSFRYLADASVPVSFDDGVNVIFGENAKYVDEEAIGKGAIIDITAAEILTKRGFDVGIAEISGTASSNYELFDNNREMVAFRNGIIRTIIPKEGAVEFAKFGDGRTSVFGYENSSGTRFVVYPIAADPTDNTTFFRNYMRQREMYAAAEWITGEAVEAMITGHPDLMVMVSRDDSSASVGLWNSFEDDIDTPVITLAHTPLTIEFAGCTGEVCGNKVTLSPLGAFKFAAFSYTF